MTPDKEFLILTKALLALSDAVLEMRVTLHQILNDQENKEALKHLEQSGKNLDRSLDQLQKLVNIVEKSVE